MASLVTALTDDSATLLSRYTDQVVLIIDGDTAGRDTTQRAIPHAGKGGLRSRVLKCRTPKDRTSSKSASADRFKNSMEEIASRTMQLAAIARKYDLPEATTRRFAICENLPPT